MSRRKLTLRLNNDVVEKAKKLGINISGFLEVKLVEYLALMNGTPRGRFELPRGQVPTSSPSSEENSVFVRRKQVEEFISLREIEGLCKGWIKTVKRFILDYLEVVNWIISKDTTLEYLKTLQKNFSVSYYRKRACQIRRFVLYLDCDWAKCIKLPREPKQIIKRVTVEDIRNTIKAFQTQSSCERYIALTLLGATSGMRPKEMYQLLPENIDLENRVVYVNHNPDSGLTTKTKRNRISLFNEEAKIALELYLKVYSKNSRLKHLFSKRQCERKFADTLLQVKDLRKFFSQEWDRKGGPTSIKKLLMGHRGDVDLRHYNAQSEEDLKKIYDKVMGKSKL